MHIHTLWGRTRTMQNLRHTESRPQSRLWDHRQGHLPENLSCSDYTMCLACLWAILPFCSVKYKRHSGKGKGLGKVGSLAYQFTTFEFTEPGTGILLYPGCEPSLGAWIDREAEQEEEKTAVLKKRNISDRNTSPFSFLLFPSFSSCLSSEESSRPETVFSEINKTNRTRAEDFSKPLNHFVQYKLWMAANYC